jgi:hypothetical protein
VFAGVLVLAGGCDRVTDEAEKLKGIAEVRATIDREEVAFGDDLTLTVETRSDPALEIDLPRVTDFDGFRLIDSGSTRSETGGVLVERRWLRLRAERAGAQTIPALEVRYRPAPVVASGGAAGEPPAPAAESGAPWKTIATTPISFEVRSLLPASDQAQAPPEIRDIKPLQPIERPRPWLWVAGATALVLALAAALAYWLKRRRGEGESVPEAPPVPAHEVALAALDRLASSEPVGDAAIRRYYFELSEIVRAYIEGRFTLNATDLTREEILASLDRLDLAETQARGLRAFLADTDAVKFAAQRPERREIVAILDWARGFVEATRPVIEAAAADSTAREAA